MTIEGKISVTLRLENAQVREVRIDAHRPLQAASMFVGRDVTTVLKTLPMVFSVCGVAQGFAAVTACGRALGVASEDAVTARDILLLAETTREHLWRVLIDWPQARGEQTGTGISKLGGLPGRFRAALFGAADPFAVHARPDPDEDALKEAVADLESLLFDAVFGESPAAWLKKAALPGTPEWEGHSAVAKHFQWLDCKGLTRFGALNCTFLPRQTCEALETHLGGPDAAKFTAHPVWQGQCCETGVFSRQYDHPAVQRQIASHGSGLGARSMARLVELAVIPRQMLDLYQRQDSVTRHTTILTATGCGIAQVEAARGRLVHRVELDGDTVRSYRILAPTEWNFHPQGVAAQGLYGLAGDEHLMREQAGIWLGAIDPCVEYELELNRA